MASDLSRWPEGYIPESHLDPESERELQTLSNNAWATMVASSWWFCAMMWGYGAGLFLLGRGPVVKFEVAALVWAGAIAVIDLFCLRAMAMVRLPARIEVGPEFLRGTVPWFSGSKRTPYGVEIHFSHIRGIWLWYPFGPIVALKRGFAGGWPKTRFLFLTRGNAKIVQSLWMKWKGGGKHSSLPGER